MDDAAIVAIKQACHEVADRYALYVDERLYDRLAEVFIEDAVLEVGTTRRGLADIIAGMEGPALIGVYHDTYRRTAQGWRIAHRSLSTTFRRPDAF